MERAAVRIVLDKLYELVLQDPHSRAFNSVRNHLDNLDRLKSVLSAVDVSLATTDQLPIPITDPNLLDWLSKLKHAAFDADDILDALGFVPRRLGSKIADLLERFEDIEKEKSNYHFPADGTTTVEDVAEERQTHSVVVPDSVVGREGDRDAVVRLLHEGGSDVKLGVVSIVGMGGLGKTTLARMVYHHESSGNRFEPMVWVSVYQDFDLPSVARKILEGLGKIPGASRPEEKVKQELGGKRFLVVLDDVWNDNKEMWEDVKELLTCGDWGCRVLVTTRSERVPVAMDSGVYRLGFMPEEECWCLFKRRAFSGRVEESEEIIAIGREIAKKSSGLPLVANVLGGLMFDKPRISQWEEVMNNEIWDCLKDDVEDEKQILPALRLSYSHLPPRAKPCFAYCAVYPLGHGLNRKKVIHHWVGNGLIKQRGNMELEAIGDEIFDDLLARCLLEDSKKAVKYWDVPTFKMHDMIHDLARFIAKDECHFLAGRNGRSGESSQTIRFLSIDRDPFAEDREVIRRSRRLRTLLTLSGLFLRGSSYDIDDVSAMDVLLKKKEERFVCDVLKRFKLLRVLDLSLSKIDRIPEAIGDLKHLRYLNFSCPRMKTLPESICSLCNLRTLKLGQCMIQVLPDGLRKLSTLHHLDIQGCTLEHMPIGMEQLVSLRTLTDFFISTKHRSSSLSELQSLKLQGELSIWNLEHLADETDAKNANLVSKEGLELLRLYWTSNDCANSITQEIANSVLDALKPHPKLRDLRLSNFCGRRLPTWMADPSSKIVKIALWNCKCVDQLQAFGQFQCLSYLQLIGLHGLKNIGEEFYGCDGTLVSFPALTELAFNDMPNLEQWTGVEGRAAFPLLHTLTLMNCPKLKLMPRFPTLQRIELWNCNDMILESIADMPSLSSVLSKVGNMTSLPNGAFMNLASLKKLSLVDCMELVSLPSEAIQQLASLEHLVINGCRDLFDLPYGIYNLTSLQKLEITYCTHLTILPQCLYSITSLKCIKLVGCLNIDWSEVGILSVCTLPEFYVEICNKKTDLSTWLFYAESLLEMRIQGEHLTRRVSGHLVSDRFLSVCCCSEMDSLPEELSMASSLECVTIDSCSALTHLSESFANLRSLHYLYIQNCPNLTALCNGLMRSLRVLLITGCSELERRCNNEQAEYWHLISHIPDKKIGSGKSKSVDRNRGWFSCSCWQSHSCKWSKRFCCSWMPSQSFCSCSTSSL